MDRLFQILVVSLLVLLTGCIHVFQSNRKTLGEDYTSYYLSHLFVDTSCYFEHLDPKVNNIYDSRNDVYTPELRLPPDLKWNNCKGYLAFYALISSDQKIIGIEPIKFYLADTSLYGPIKYYYRKGGRVKKIRLRGYDSFRSDIIDHVQGLKLNCYTSPPKDTSYAFCEIRLLPSR